MPTFSNPSRPHRLAAFAGVLTALALIVAGCEESTPEPTPEPTGFTSEEEALEAARATFEAYVRATNRVDFADLSTAEPVYTWLTDEALSSAKKAYSESHANSSSRTGNSVVLLSELRSYDLDDGTVSLDACVDVSEVKVLDTSGDSLVNADRAPVQAVRASLVVNDETSTGFVIDSTSGREDGPSCADLD